MSKRAPYLSRSSGATRSDSTDSQFTETDEELTFLEACLECDEDALYDIILDGITWEQVNERDKSGRVRLLSIHMYTIYICCNISVVSQIAQTGTRLLKWLHTLEVRVYMYR